MVKLRPRLSKNKQSNKLFKPFAKKRNNHCAFESVYKMCIILHQNYEGAGRRGKARRGITQTDKRTNGAIANVCRLIDSQAPAYRTVNIKLKAALSRLLRGRGPTLRYDTIRKSMNGMNVPVY